MERTGEESTMKAAVIGIGSNSVRMLVAEAVEGKIHRIGRERDGTRLFAGLDAQKRLSQEAMAASCAAVGKMAESARAQGVAEVRLFATSATRDAANQAAFSALLREKTGLTLEICSGDEEAALSFLGATDGGHSGVIDIGGGSTEIIVGQGLDIQYAFSCQMGAVRLHQRMLIRSHEDLATVQELATAILEEKLREHPEMTMPENWWGTGGTFTTLAAMVKRIDWTDRTYMHGTVIHLADVTRLAWKLADLSVEDRRKLPGLQPNRADIVVHGICILRAVMERLGLESITVSEYGNLDGYFKRAYLMQPI